MTVNYYVYGAYSVSLSLSTNKSPSDGHQVDWNDKKWMSTFIRKYIATEPRKGKTLPEIAVRQKWQNRH